MLFFGCTHGIWKFPGQGLNLSHSCNLWHSSGNAGPLTQHTTVGTLSLIFFCLFFFFCLFAFSRAAPAGYRDSQARDLIRAMGTGLRQSHSNMGSSCVYDLHHSSQQRWILSKARDRTWNLMVPRGSLTTEPRRKLLIFFFFYFNEAVKFWNQTLDWSHLLLRDFWQITKSFRESFLLFGLFLGPYPWHRWVPG